MIWVLDVGWGLGWTWDVGWEGLARKWPLTVAVAGRRRRDLLRSRRSPNPRSARWKHRGRYRTFCCVKAPYSSD